MIRMLIFLPFVISAFTPADQALAYVSPHELPNSFSCDPQKKEYACVDYNKEIFCYAERGMVMAFSQHPAYSSAPIVQLFPVYFPPSNARLDQHFTNYIEFLAEAYQRSLMKQRYTIMGRGGIIIEQKPFNVHFSISAPQDPKSDRQEWTIEILRYGKVEMNLLWKENEISVFYIRNMADGSYTESRFSYSADAKCPRPVNLDPSPKQSE